MPPTDESRDLGGQRDSVGAVRSASHRTDRSRTHLGRYVGRSAHGTAGRAGDPGAHGCDAHHAIKGLSMTEMDHRPTDRPIGIARRKKPNGTARCYVRFAVLGDRGGQRAPVGVSGGWPYLLADAIASSHDVSWCDASASGATAYDVRRAQLRVAVAHRPHLVALCAGLVDARRRDWDVGEVRSHLTHCARQLTRQGAVILTTAVSRRVGIRRDRVEQLNAVYDELVRQFATVHLDHRLGAAAVADQFAGVLSARGLEVRR